MQRSFYALAALSYALCLAAGTRVEAMPIQPYTITLWDVPSTNQVRGTASFQGLPKGVAVQVSLKVAGPGPDAAFVGTGTCKAYKKLYALKPAVNGLSNTVLPSAGMLDLFTKPHVVVLPGLKYCGAVKSSSLH